MRRILCLWLPNWPIQRLLAALRVHERSSLPLPLGEGRGEGLAAPAAPRCSGKTKHPHPNPLPKGEGTILIQPHDPAADLAALASLAEHCEWFSPLVGWRTVGSGPRSKVQSPKSSADVGLGTLDFGPATGPDCLFLDVTGIGVLFGGEEALAREVISDAARAGYEARVAIAGTVGAAWAGTRVQGSGFRVQEPGVSGQQQATDHRPPTTDRPWPLSALRLPAETLDLLAQLGVTQLDQLLALPRQSLRARFGERLLLRIDQFFGTAQETIVAHRPPPKFTAEMILEYPAERQDVIAQILQQLVERLASDLAERREGALQLVCRLDCALRTPLLLQVGLFRPSAEAAHLDELVRMQLEQAALHGPVGRITLSAPLTAPLENRQGELFAGGEHQAQRQLAQLIDRCTSRLGADAVVRPELRADPLPERGFKTQKAAKGFGGRGSGVDRKQRRSVLGTQYSVPSTKSRRRASVAADSRPPTPESPRSPLDRPLALYDPPLPLRVVAVAPDGPPASFELRGQPQSVVDHWGPERIETGWWRGRSVRRDYWRIETERGQRFWLFRNLNDGTWHLHGAYG